MRFAEPVRNVLAILVAAVGLTFALLVLSMMVDTTSWGFDYAAYHLAAERLLATGTPYQPQLLAAPFRVGPFGLYLYSPVPAALLAPLVALPVAQATWLWLGLRMALLALMCLLMPVSRRLRLVTFAVACLSLPFLRDLVLGNVSLVVTFFAIVGWRYLDRPLSSAAIAASMALRPPMGLFLGWWLLRGRWRPLAWAVATGAVILLLSMPFVGLRGWLEYLIVLSHAGDFEGVIRNLALGALVEAAGGPPWAAVVATAGGYVLAAGAVFVSLRRDVETSYVVTLGATLLLSPLLWEHYLTHLIVPAAFLAARGRPWALGLPLLCWVLPEPAYSLLAVAGLLLPFFAPQRGEPAGSVLERLIGRPAAAPA